MDFHVYLLVATFFNTILSPDWLITVRVKMNIEKTEMTNDNKKKTPTSDTQSTASNTHKAIDRRKKISTFRQNQVVITNHITNTW